MCWVRWTLPPGAHHSALGPLGPWDRQSPSGRSLHPLEALHTDPGLATPFLPRDGQGGCVQKASPTGGGPGSRQAALPAWDPRRAGAGTVWCLPPHHSPPPFITTHPTAAHPQVPGRLPNEVSVPWKGPTS